MSQVFFHQRLQKVIRKWFVTKITCTQKPVSSHSQSSQVMRDTKALCIIGVPVRCWPIWGVFDLYRGGAWLRYCEWTIDRAGVGGAAGGECTVQWSSSEDAQTLCLMISIFTRCLQVSFPSSWTPKDLFHLHTFPVCHFGSIGFLFLSLPKARYISLHFPGTTTISFWYI